MPARRSYVGCCPAAMPIFWNLGWGFPGAGRYAPVRSPPVEPTASRSSWVPRSSEWASIRLGPVSRPIREAGLSAAKPSTQRLRCLTTTGFAALYPSYGNTCPASPAWEQTPTLRRRVCFLAAGDPCPSYGSMRPLPAAPQGSIPGSRRTTQAGSPQLEPPALPGRTVSAIVPWTADAGQVHESSYIRCARNSNPELGKLSPGIAQK